jgi:septal ring factor EnvC (AmiA/AmiB activator)
MEKLSRYLPLAALLALLIFLVLFLYSSSRLNEAIDRLNAAEQKIDETLVTLSSAKTAIDTVQKDLATFGTYVKDIQGRVEIMDLTQRSEDEQFKNQRSRINVRLKELYRDVESTGKELPEIPVVEAGKKQ